MVPNLKKELEHLKPQVLPSPWPGHEHVRGFGVFGLPLSSGYTIALRVFPVNDFAPYITLWLQSPDKKWTIYYDALRPDIACPRYYGKVVEQTIAASITLEWTSAAVLRVVMDKPAMQWTVSMRQPLYLAVLNAISKRMPFWTWKSSALLKLREWLARKLGIGNIQLAGIMPSGHFGILMPKRMYFIDHTNIIFEGADLGRAISVSPNPTIGDVPLPARGIFAIGEAHWEIEDINEYQQTRAALGVY